MSEVPTSTSKAKSDSTFPPLTPNTAPTSVTGSSRDSQLICFHGCPKAQSFRRVSEWKKHDREVHQGRLFYCHACGYKEKRRYNHTKKHGNCTGTPVEVEVTKVSGCGICPTPLLDHESRVLHILRHQRGASQLEDWEFSQEIRSLMLQPALTPALYRKPWYDDLERLSWNAEDCEALKEVLEEGQFTNPDIVLEDAYSLSYTDEKAQDHQVQERFDASLFPEQSTLSAVEQRQAIMLDKHESQDLVDSLREVRIPNVNADEQPNELNSVMDPGLFSTDSICNENGAPARNFDLTHLNPNNADPYDGVDPSLYSTDYSSNFVWMRPELQLRDCSSLFGQELDLSQQYQDGGSHNTSLLEDDREDGVFCTIEFNED